MDGGRRGAPALSILQCVRSSGFSGTKKPAAGDTSQRAFTLSVERTFPPRNAYVRRLCLSTAPIE
jgi:hypothetical protein